MDDIYILTPETLIETMRKGSIGFEDLVEILDKAESRRETVFVKLVPATAMWLKKEGKRQTKWKRVPNHILVESVMEYLHSPEAWND